MFSPEAREAPEARARADDSASLGAVRSLATAADNQLQVMLYFCAGIHLGHAVGNSCVVQCQHTRPDQLRELAQGI